MRKTFSSLILAAGLCGAVTAPADIALQRLKATYVKNLAEIEEEAAQAGQAWPAEYAARLEDMQKQFQQAGDLENVLAVKQECERFKQTGSVPESAFVNAPAALKALQERAEAMPERIDLGRSRKIVSLTDQYTAALEKLQTSLTAKGSLNDALDVRDEVQRVKASEAVTSARFALSDAESRSSTPPAVGDESPSESAGEKTPGDLLPDTGQWKRVPEALRNALVLYYPFDADERLSITDASGHKHAGRRSGAKWTARGAAGGGMGFDARTDAIEVPDSADWDFGVDDDWSFAFFVRVANRLENATFYSRGADKRSLRGGQNYLGYESSGSSSGLVWGPINGGWKTGETLHEDRWQHVVVVHVGSEQTAYVYVNGRECARTQVKSVALSSGPIKFGGEAVSGFLKGTMDEIMIFRSALSGYDVRTLYTALGGDDITRAAEDRNDDARIGRFRRPAAPPPPRFGGGRGRR